MKKAAWTVLILLCFPVLMIAQEAENTGEIENNLNKLFFGITNYSQRFNIKVILRSSENFYGYKEATLSNLTLIQSGFEENEILNKLGHRNEVTIYFNNDDILDHILISSEYELNQASLCEQQFIDIALMFDKLSYQMTPTKTTNDRKQMIGEGVSLYYSETMVKKNKPYLRVEFIETQRNSYQFETRYYPERLK